MMELSWEREICLTISDYARRQKQTFPPLRNAGDSQAGAADPRMAAYFRGEHHPQCALMPRTGYVAVASSVIIGYIAGHLSTRHGCDGEVQYLFVAPEFRRLGVAADLLRQLAAWFQEQPRRRNLWVTDTLQWAPE